MNTMHVTTLAGLEEVYQRRSYINITLMIIGIQVQLLSGMRGFVQCAIIIDQNWTMYIYLSLVIK